jgi:hypothetical protein
MMIASTMMMTMQELYLDDMAAATLLCALLHSLAVRHCSLQSAGVPCCLAFSLLVLGTVEPGGALRRVKHHSGTCWLASHTLLLLWQLVWLNPRSSEWKDCWLRCLWFSALVNCVYLKLDVALPCLHMAIFAWVFPAARAVAC